MDNVEVTPGSGAVIATDDVSGVQFQRVKFDLGADGASDPVVGSLPTTEASAADILAAAQAIQAAVETLDNTVAGSELQVDVVTSALPSGAATEATLGSVESELSGVNGKLTTITGHVDGLEGLLGTIDADTGTIAGAVSGSEMQVDVVTLPALSAGSANIGDVDVLTVPADPFGANADAAATAGSTGSIQAKLRLITSQLDTIKTSLDALDNTVGGSELQVDVVGALPAGSNAIGKLAANDGVDIGNVDVASVPADPFGANADAASATGSISAKLRFIAATGIPVTSVPSHAVTNAGTFPVQVDGSALTALQLIDDPVQTDDGNGFTVASSKVNMVGYLADESSTDSVDEGDAGAARITLDRKQVVTPYPHTAGGLSVYQGNGSDGGGGVLVATAQAAKGSAGQVYGWYIYNPNTVASFVHFYNVASGSVSVGTTNPLMSITIPALAAANVMGTHGITFDTAITIAATTTAGGNTAPSTGLDATIFYK